MLASPLVSVLRKVVAGDLDGATDHVPAEQLVALLESSSVHGVLPVVGRSLALSERLGLVPDSWNEALSARVRQSLRLAGEVLVVSRALTHAGVPFRILKGIPLAQQAYGDVALRESGDVDVLVDPSSLASALTALRDAGYALGPDRDESSHLRSAHREAMANMRALSEANAGTAASPALASYLKLDSEITLRRERRGVVDLHWRVCRSRHLMDLPNGMAESVVVVSGIPIPVLPAEVGVCYLSAHALRHGWSQLKWLLDIPLLMRSANLAPEEISEAARRLGVSGPVRTALQLSSDLLGWPLSREYSARPTGRWEQRTTAQANRRMTRITPFESPQAEGRNVLIAQLSYLRRPTSIARTLEEALVPVEYLTDWIDPWPRRALRFVLMSGLGWLRESLIGRARP